MPAGEGFLFLEFPNLQAADGRSNAIYNSMRQGRPADPGEKTRLWYIVEERPGGPSMGVGAIMWVPDTPEDLANFSPGEQSSMKQRNELDPAFFAYRDAIEDAQSNA